MSRILSTYEIAWRKGAGHAVPADGVLHDDEDLEALTAPVVVTTAPVAVPPPAAAVQPPAAKPAAPPAKPGKA